MQLFYKYVPWGTEFCEFDTLQDAQNDAENCWNFGAEEEAYGIVVENGRVVLVTAFDGDEWIQESDPELIKEIENSL